MRTETIMIGEHPLPKEFDVLLGEAIEESLSALFGKRVLESFYSCLDRRFDLGLDEIPCRLETVYEVLTDVFGISGAGTIGRSMARSLYRKLNLQFEAYPGLKLMDYVEIAKRKLSQASSASAQLQLGTR